MSFGRALTRGLPRGRRVPLPRPRLSLRSRWVRRLLIVVVLLGALLLGGWLWVRDSSLVAVTKVTVTGATGPDAGAIRSALVGAARSMTTLDVNMSRLRSAVSPFPVVSEVRATTQFPHGMRIHVVERPPVAMVTVAGKNIAVAGDGTLLHDMAVGAPLPLIPLTVPPGGPRLTGPALQSARLLAAAPSQLIPKVAQISTEAGHGLVAQIRGGPKIYFGNSSSAHAKWLAASAVLADTGSAGAHTSTSPTRCARRRAPGPRPDRRHRARADPRRRRRGRPRTPRARPARARPQATRARPRATPATPARATRAPATRATRAPATRATRAPATPATRARATRGEGRAADNPQLKVEAGWRATLRPSLRIPGSATNIASAPGPLTCHISNT